MKKGTVSRQQAMYEDTNDILGFIKNTLSKKYGGFFPNTILISLVAIQMEILAAIKQTSEEQYEYMLEEFLDSVRDVVENHEEIVSEIIKTREEMQYGKYSLLQKPVYED